MDAFAPWRFDPGCPDWDAIAGARALRQPRRRLRWVRHAGTALMSALLVGGLALLAEEQAPPPGEILALSFLPEAGFPPRASDAPPAAAFTAQSGRFAGDGAFIRLGEGLSGGLFLEAVRVAAEAGGLAVTRSGRPTGVATPLGPAELLPVTLEDRAGRTRACTAFRIAGVPSLSGVHCAGDAPCAEAFDWGGALAAVAGALGPACPAPTAELGGNKASSRASFPQPRRDRATAVDRPRGAARPNS